jgi:hypothetical protein
MYSKQPYWPWKRWCSINDEKIDILILNLECIYCNQNGGARLLVPAMWLCNNFACVSLTCSQSSSPDFSLIQTYDNLRIWHYAPPAGRYHSEASLK